MLTAKLFAAIAVAGTTGTTVLAFAENRNVTACAPAFDQSTRQHPEEVGSLLLRRSVDGGKTWGAMQSLFVGNIDFYAVTVAGDGLTVC